MIWGRRRRDEPRWGERRLDAWGDGFAQGLVIGILAGAISMGVFCVALGQEIRPTPRDAMGWAAEHLVQQPNRSDWRYVLADPWVEPSWTGAIAVALNTAINREAVPYRPTVLANGWMLAVDFSMLSSDPLERARVLAVWDGLATIEPYFHVPATNSGLKVPVVASHLPPEHVETVVAWSDQANRHGVVPIYRAGFVVWQILSADDGVYYRIRGVKRGGDCDRCKGSGKLRLIQSGRIITCPDCGGASKSERTEEGTWLADRGFSVADSARFRADLRKGVIRSQVLGGPRSALFVRGLVGRGWITEDVVGDDPRKHPIHSLLPRADGTLPAQAKELIVEMPWGGHDFLLTNGDAGEIQTKAIIAGIAATDTTVPDPHPKTLQPAISCIRCHWAKQFGSEPRRDMAGLQPVANDVQTILAPEGGVDILAKGSELSRLAGLYAGGHLFDYELDLGRARLALAVQSVTERIVPDKPAGLSVREAGLAVQDLYAAYKYEDVSAERACLELGLEPGEQPTAILAEAIGGAADNPNATLLALLRGLSVRREDWELVYHDAYLRTIAGEEGRDEAVE